VSVWIAEVRRRAYFVPQYLADLDAARAKRLCCFGIFSRLAPFVIRRNVARKRKQAIWEKTI
jgi:hypothetical protein